MRAALRDAHKKLRVAQRDALKRDALGQEAGLHQARQGDSPRELVRLVEPDQIHDPALAAALKPGIYRVRIEIETTKTKIIRDLINLI